ncbi:hypothetical protein HDU90_003213 [Geranomyces variabilis]|nr:hypothetical protein HDU90_003213 [Geranomyces variabilis]
MTPARPELDEDDPPTDAEIARWSSMRSVFEKRILVRNKEYGGKDLERLAEKWEKAIRAGAKLYLPKIDRAACQRLACVVVTTPGFGSPHGRSSSLRRTCPSSDSMLTIKYEERTPYSDKRPDVQASFGTRVAARGEIKSMWVAHMKKDQSRVVRADN